MNFDKITEQLRQQVVEGEQDNLEFFLDLADKLEVVDETSARQALTMSLQARKKKQALLASKADALREYTALKEKIAEPLRILELVLSRIEVELIHKLGAYYRDSEVVMQVDDGSMRTVSRWDYVVTDIGELPPQYLCADKAAIDRAVKMGVRHIPGVTIFETNELTIRVKN
jgi:hypothetical protein